MQGNFLSRGKFIIFVEGAMASLAQMKGDAAFGGKGGGYFLLGKNVGAQAEHGGGNLIPRDTVAQERPVQMPGQCGSGSGIEKKCQK